MRAFAVSMLAMFTLMAFGCSTAPNTDSGREQLHNDSAASFKDFKAQDTGMQSFVDGAYGYAIFPSVGKAAVGVGGSYGRGELWEQGNRVGYCDITQGTVGASLGGQDQSELLVFQDKHSMDQFKSGNFAFAAQASAVAMKAGAAASAKYENGVAVFVMSRGGLMVDASIGGQKFSYRPLD